MNTRYLGLAIRSGDSTHYLGATPLHEVSEPKLVRMMAGCLQLLELYHIVVLFLVLCNKHHHTHHNQAKRH